MAQRDRDATLPANAEQSGSNNVLVSQGGSGNVAVVFTPPADDTSAVAYVRSLPSPDAIDEPDRPTPSWLALNNERIARYEHNRGLFLVHDWRPSAEPGQVVDVEVRLAQHGEGPLTNDEVYAVEYTLGPRFSNHSLVANNADEGFKIEVSMWGPMLCIARVYIATTPYRSP
jgi:hypothetical protein